jgi:hypothetical protein
MTWSAAAVKNLKYFSPVGGAAATFIVYRRRRLENFNFFPLSATRRLCLFLIGRAAARKFTNEKFFPK